MSSLKVLYEDNHIIAVVKPAGVLTQGDRSGEASLYDMVKDYIRIKKGKPLGNVYPVRNSDGSQRKISNGVFLGLVHRLDKPVSGIVLFGKTSKGAARLSEQFRNHTVQKTYYGIVVGKLEKEKGEIKEKVNKISFFAEGFTEKSDEELLKEIKKATKTRTAELSWEVVPPSVAARMLGGEVPTESRTREEVGAAGIKSGKFTLLKILPKTGRFHQIRIQMANMSHPILGDKKYGYRHSYASEGRSGWENKNSIALCATAISFKTATGEKTINLEIPLPAEWDSYLK